MKVVSVNPISDPLWAQLVQHQRSCVFHSPAWLQVLEDTYGFELGAHVILNEAGEPIAGLPYGRVSDFFGTRLLTLPFSDYTDPLIETEAQWRALIDPVLAEGYPVTVRCVHSTIPLQDDRFVLAKQAMWHGMDVRPEVEQLWAYVHEAGRRAIRKAQKNGVVVRQADRMEDLRAFFDLHLRVRKYKYHLLAQPYAFLENIWKRFVATGNGALLLAEYQGKAIGGILFLHWKDTLYYKFNASAADALGCRPNDLVLWHGIQYAKAQGFSYLDFGLSDLDQEGLLRYKRKYATEEKLISFLKHASAPTPAERQLRCLLGELTGLLTDAAVPDEISDQAGALLYRYFV